MVLDHPCLDCSSGRVRWAPETMSVLLDFFWALLQAMVMCVFIFWGLAVSVVLAVFGLVLLTIVRERR